MIKSATKWLTVRNSTPIFRQKKRTARDKTLVPAGKAALSGQASRSASALASSTIHQHKVRFLMDTRSREPSQIA
jgi:hypothetical protein